MSEQKRANRDRHQTQQLAQHFLGSAYRSSVNSFWDGWGLQELPEDQQGACRAAERQLWGGCDFQQLLTKLFMIKGCFEL